jgi:hypothetical protein
MNSFERFVVIFLTGAALQGKASGNSLSGDGHYADSLLPRTSNHLQNDERALLRLSRVRKGPLTYKAGYRLFSDLAGVSARLKLYSLAMRCYYKALEYRHPGMLSGYRIPLFIYPDTTHGVAGDDRMLAQADSDLIGDPGEDGISDSSFEEHLPATDSGLYAFDNYTRGAQNRVPVESPLVKISEILASFEDGKQARSYALILQVKQPLPGKRKAFTHINNVGHMFVTLIKYNVDHSVVTRSFGFYPHKTNFFAGTPIHPGSAATFKDDAQHDWDEVVGKFVSHRRFYKIIDLLKQYDRLSYNLNRNNCTDFGLSVAALGGIRIANTRGRWPLGKGNNPANAGQSILEERFQNVDPDYGEPLFTDHNLASGKAQ